MATYTSNYNLEKPEATDPFEDFRESYNDNMDIIDANLGGGGGGGGHTIVDENGSDMPAESKLQFTGNVSVSDDNVNGATVVDVLGGGGNVYGAFIDPNRILASGTYSNSNPLIYTATEDCYADVAFLSADGDKNVYGYIDGVQIDQLFNNSGIVVSNEIYPLRKGQTLRVETSRINNDSTYTVYGVTQGTNGIFAPVIYSDNERVIGVWRDNKPLYQRTFDLGSDLSISYSAWVSSGVTLTNVESLITAYGTRSDNSFQGYVLAWNDNTDLKLTTPRNGNNSFIRYLTLQYTKTTDVAGSGNWNTDGVPTHHYSTSEQVIGTWVNNKPVYQKTFVFTPTALTTLIDVSGLQIEDLIERKGTFTRNAGSQIQQKAVEYRTEAPSSNNYGIQCELRDTNLQVSINGYAYTEITEFRITLQYTKTTD